MVADSSNHGERLATVEAQQEFLAKRQQEIFETQKEQFEQLKELNSKLTDILLLLSRWKGIGASLIIIGSILGSILTALAALALRIWDWLFSKLPHS